MFNAPTLYRLLRAEIAIGLPQKSRELKLSIEIHRPAEAARQEWIT
jgi:hypothetical protein